MHECIVALQARAEHASFIFRVPHLCHIWHRHFISQSRITGEDKDQAAFFTAGVRLNRAAYPFLVQIRHGHALAGAIKCPTVVAALYTALIIHNALAQRHLPMCATVFQRIDRPIFRANKCNRVPCIARSKCFAGAHFMRPRHRVPEIRITIDLPKIVMRRIRTVRLFALGLFHQHDVTLSESNKADAAGTTSP